MVLNLQMEAIGSLLVLGFLTFSYASIRNCMVRDIKHDRLWLPGAMAPSTDDSYWTDSGFWGVWQRDQRAILLSYVMLILVTIRFAGSKVEFGLSFLPENEIMQKLLLILYAVFLVVYIEVSSAVIRFSMLDTSIRTGEVYVMNVKSITDRYNRALGYTPASQHW